MKSSPNYNMLYKGMHYYIEHYNKPMMLSIFTKKMEGRINLRWTHMRFTQLFKLYDKDFFEHVIQSKTHLNIVQFCSQVKFLTLSYVRNLISRLKHVDCKPVENSNSKLILACKLDNPKRNVLYFQGQHHIDMMGHIQF